jgi:hypothetical protein
MYVFTAKSNFLINVMFQSTRKPAIEVWTFWKSYNVQTDFNTSIATEFVCLFVCL